MEYKKPEPTAIKVWRLQRLIELLICILVSAAAIVIVLTAFPDERKIFTIICAVLGVTFIYKFAGFFVYPLIEYRQWKYLISDEKIEIIHGIFFIKRDIIPAIRIQNVTVKQGPIYRKYKLYTVEIALASGTFDIVGLSRETSEEIAESVREKLCIRLKRKEEI